MDEQLEFSLGGVSSTSLRLSSILLALLVVLWCPDVQAAATLAAQEMPAVDSATPAGQYHDADPQLRRLMAIMLKENPDIRRAKARWRSGLQKIPQARSLADPQLSYRYFTRSPETRVGPQDQAFDLTQAIPWAGKRRLQAERAEEFAGSLFWNVRDIERRLVANLKKNYFQAGYVQEALTINREEMEILRRFEAIALTRYATGGGIQQSVIKVQTDITRLADREISLQKQLDIFTRRLAQLMGRPEAELILKTVDLLLLPVQYETRQLEESAIASHPLIHELERLIVADERWSRRQTLESRPDFKVGLSYIDVGRREDTAGQLIPPEGNGKDSVSLLVSINLPIYRKRIRAGIAEARESTASNQQALTSAEDQLRYLVQEAVLRLESTEQQAHLYRDVLIPQAEESLASSESAYTTNKQDFLDLLDAERILFQVRLTHKRLLADYWIALADIEQATGRAFPVSEMPADNAGQEDSP